MNSRLSHIFYMWSKVFLVIFAIAFAYIYWWEGLSLVASLLNALPLVGVSLVYFTLGKFNVFWRDADGQL